MAHAVVEQVVEQPASKAIILQFGGRDRTESPHVVLPAPRKPESTVTGSVSVRPAAFMARTISLTLKQAQDLVASCSLEILWLHVELLKIAVLPVPEQYLPSAAVNVSAHESPDTTVERRPGGRCQAGKAGRHPKLPFAVEHHGERHDVLVPNVTEACI
eukprot:2812741-Prymnesium_polylepis.1